MAKSERDLQSRELRCPQCGGEIERTRCMCDWCGAVLHLAPRGDALRLEGVVCFACGHGNPGSERQRSCARCGRAFAATCPGCAAPVPLTHRCCQGCGLSVEDFDTERARLAVAEGLERRHSERLMLALLRWLVVVGIALVALGLILGRSDTDLRRRLVVAGAGTGSAGALPLGLARAAGTRFRRREA